jgi:tryptophan-rich sensory protein
MKKIKWFPLVLSILLCEFAGVVGSLFTSPSIPTWYASLIKPSFNPPSWLFAPVWTTLYFLMGISLYLIWEKGKKTINLVKLFLFHLVLNSLWSIIFFGGKNIFLALIEIIALWAIILVLIVKFYKINKISAYLLIPYILWVSFASFLNYSLWILNR